MIKTKMKKERSIQYVNFIFNKKKTKQNKALEIEGFHFSFYSHQCGL